MKEEAKNTASNAEAKKKPAVQFVHTGEADPSAGACAPATLIIRKYLTPDEVFNVILELEKYINQLSQMFSNTAKEIDPEILDVLYMDSRYLDGEIATLGVFDESKAIRIEVREGGIYLAGAEEIPKMDEFPVTLEYTLVEDNVPEEKVMKLLKSNRFLEV